MEMVTPHLYYCAAYNHLRCTITVAIESDHDKLSVGNHINIMSWPDDKYTLLWNDSKLIVHS